MMTTRDVIAAHGDCVTLTPDAKLIRAAQRQQQRRRVATKQRTSAAGRDTDRLTACLAGDVPYAPSRDLQRNSRSAAATTRPSVQRISLPCLFTVVTRILA